VEQYINNQAMVQVLGRPDAREQMLKAGVDSVASSPEGFIAYIAADRAKWGQLVKAAGIK
jgi:tripartite-type tricarboxylate transporter receptor subunit TctC